MEVLHVLSVVSTGLFAGLMMTLVFLLQRQWNDQDRATYATSFRQFLLAAKGHPLVTLLTFASFIAPSILAVLAFRAGLRDVGTLDAIAAGTFFLGCFLVTTLLNLPIYDRVIAWQDESDAGEWQAVRTRFFVLNLIRFTCALASFLLLAVAGISS